MPFVKIILNAKLCLMEAGRRRGGGGFEEELHNDAFVLMDLTAWVISGQKNTREQ